MLYITFNCSPPSVTGYKIHLEQWHCTALLLQLSVNLLYISYLQQSKYMVYANIIMFILRKA